MFEEYIEKNVNSVLNAFDLTKEKVFIDEIVANKDISNFYKAFALAELDWWMLEEEENRRKNQNFDFSKSELQTQILEFESNLRKYAFLNIDDFTDFINFAVKSRINFLCRPQFTLSNFCFNAVYEEKVNRIIKKLAYFSDYKYFNTSFLSKLEENNFNTDSIISKDDFENMIEEIDFENILNLSSKEFVELVNPIYNFFNVIDEESNEQLVPSEALLIFFDDKSINPIVSSLQKKYENAEYKFLKRDTLHQFIIQMIEATESGEIEEEEESVFDNIESNEEIESVFTSIEGNEELDNLEASIEVFEEESNSQNEEKEEFESSFDKILSEYDLDENENELALISDSSDIESDLMSAFNELNGTNEVIEAIPKAIINEEDIIPKEFEAFDLLDAEDELISEENEVSESYIDIDEFDISDDEDASSESLNENDNFDFDKFETLLETQKEEVEEQKSELVDDVELYNEFNSLLGQIGNLDPIQEDEEEIIQIFEDDEAHLKPINTALIGEVILDEIEDKLNIQIEDEVKVEKDVIEEAKELLMHYNEENDEDNIEDIGKLLDDISKINN